MAEDMEPRANRDAKQIRTSLRNYPTGKENVLTFILKSVALTLEVFLHGLIGERYLTWPRMIAGLLVIWVVGHVGTPWDMRDVEVLQNFHFKLPHFSLVEAGKIYGLPVEVPIFAKTSFEGVPILAVVMSIYLAFAEWRMLEIFIYNRFAVNTHNRSSGEPYAVWNNLYILFDRLNFKGDLVKQVCEPALCFFAGICVLANAPSQFHFLGLWITTASIALFLKAWLENKGRKKMFLDQIANRMDAQALALQQNEVQREVDEFDEVPACGEAGSKN